MPKEPIPDWKDERCSKAATDFAALHVDKARDVSRRVTYGGEGDSRLMRLLADVFDAGRRFEDQQKTTTDERLDKLLRKVTAIQNRVGAADNEGDAAPNAM